MRPITRIMISGAMLTMLSGCIDITTHVQPDQPGIKPVISGRDCVPIVAGLGFGTNRVEVAMLHAGPEGHENNRNEPDQQITKIHSIALEESVVLVFGKRCVVVTGEP